MPENELKNGERKTSEPTAWELRERYRKAHLIHQRIRTHIAKVCDGKHTLISDNGITLLQDEAGKLLREMKEIEAVFKARKWAM